jgi:hypothetical protein
MKEVKFVVTYPFAEEDEGAELAAYIVAEGECGEAILFHPKENDHSCASLDFCRKVGRHYESSGPDCWMNLTKKQAAVYERLL